MVFAVASSKGTTLIRTTGDTIPEANRELFIFEKVDGYWKIARYMFGIFIETDGFCSSLDLALFPINVHDSASGISGNFSIFNAITVSRQFSTR